MSDPRRPPLLSPRALLRELVFLVRMRASERRFRRHHEAWRRHQVATNKRLDGMAAEVELRVGLCERNAVARAGHASLWTTSAVPVAGSRGRPGIPDGTPWSMARQDQG